MQRRTFCAVTVIVFCCLYWKKRMKNAWDQQNILLNVDEHPGRWQLRALVLERTIHQSSTSSLKYFVWFPRHWWPLCTSVNVTVREALHYTEREKTVIKTRIIPWTWRKCVQDREVLYIGSQIYRKIYSIVLLGGPMQ